MRKHIFKYGILFGVTLTIYSFILYLNGYYVDQDVMHLIFLIFLTVGNISLGLVKFKNYNDGYISILEALKIGVGISIIGGLVVSLWEILLLHVIDPEVMNQLKEHSFKKIAETSTDFTKQDMDGQIEFINKIKSPIIMLISALVEDIFIGFLFSLIGGLIIRKKRDPFN
ncbi:DUF4199 domain-containing protein [uncultured Aquimarina sp.]|uniref:DUF4199 domain-containing protein n=1 Tax=uncultured Aquimarina sp. TaxID=575652 RepID=UPI00262524AA|nr:DUF4199 domain-containing protein [uncultured Aquimarina sp.]